MTKAATHRRDVTGQKWRGGELPEDVTAPIAESKTKMTEYLKAEMVRESGETKVRLTNTHPSRRIVAIESIPWFYNWDNGSGPTPRMIKFQPISKPLAPGESVVIPHQSFYVGVNEWLPHDAANDSLIQTARSSTSRRSAAENFEFSYRVEDEELHTLDLSQGIPKP